MSWISTWVFCIFSYLSAQADANAPTSTLVSRLRSALQRSRHVWALLPTPSRHSPIGGPQSAATSQAVKVQNLGKNLTSQAQSD